MQSITTYILSQKADTDIDTIFDYTENKFGFNQAVSYVGNLDIIFKQLIKHPNLGKERNEIKNGILSLSVGEHIVFYSIYKNCIRIVRVLHGRSDIPSQF